MPVLPRLRTLLRWGRVILALGILYGLLRWFEHRQIYFPSRHAAAEASLLGIPFEELWLTAADGVRLHGWFFPARPGVRVRPLVLLHCHGNAGNIRHRLDTAAGLLETGAAVLLFDYRGYGRSAGRPSEAGTYLDAQAAHAWLCQRGFAPHQIVVMGESLGGAVAAELALRESLGGLVLVSTFTSIPDLGAELFPWLPVRWLVRTRYDTHAKLARVTAPVLVVHSRQDTLIGFHHAERNFAAAREPKWLCEIPGDHNDPYWETASFRTALNRFLDEVERRAVPANARANPAPFLDPPRGGA